MTLANDPISQDPQSDADNAEESQQESTGMGRAFRALVDALPNAPSKPNVSRNERAISMAAGAALALFGLTRRSVPGLVVAAIGGALVSRGVTGKCAAYQALGIDTARDPEDGATPNDYFTRGIHVEVSHTINKPASELYAFWKNFQNLPRIMKHLESVEMLSEVRSKWTAKAPAIVGGKVTWEAEVINDEPDKLIAWRSLAGSTVDNAGSVRFVSAPGDRGTEVRVVIDYIPPAGAVGKWVAKLFGEEPQQQIEEDLRNFKRIMEAGEIATIAGQPRGSCDKSGSTQTG